jgi:hypothetical protein
MERRRLLSTFTVTSTADSGSGSLRQAILMSDAPHAGADQINFAIPAATASPSLDFPVSGFDPTTQTWTITLSSPLPPLAHQVTIDGFTQGQTGIPFRYPAEESLQNLSLSGNPIGGTYTLTTQAPLPVVTTGPIGPNATSADVAAALNAALPQTDPPTNVIALPGGALSIAFTGKFGGITLPPLIANSSLIGAGGAIASVSVSVSPPSMPTEITSAPSGIAALDGNNAMPRVIIDGAGLTGAGLEIASSGTIVRGLIIDHFGVLGQANQPGVGVSVDAGVVGALIQGDDIGIYPLFHVDPTTGQPLPAPNYETLAGHGNASQGVLIAGTNATVGGVETQDADVIIGNGAEGVSIVPGAQGNQVVGNQIGTLGPLDMGGVYFIVPNGSDGVRIADSSNQVGGAGTGAGNLISGNLGDGVHVVGPASTRVNILGNYIGVGAGGGFLIGSDDPGNLGDGVALDNAGDNTVGGPSKADRNVISANGGAGVRVFGVPAVRNLVENNFIGLTSDGISALGNAQAGVEITSASNTVGSGNVISANFRGVELSGSGATGNLVTGNFIGTDSDGAADLGNAQEGVRIDGAPGNVVQGNAQGSQVISGNNVGVLINGLGAAGNLVTGSFIGTDSTGKLDLGNSQAGVQIVDAPSNTIGAPTSTGRNLISANHRGVVITGAGATGTVVQGNSIGTGTTGQEVLGNELDGVLITGAASGALIGGGSLANANVVAFNRGDGVRIEGSSASNSILTNAIFANLGPGIDLVPPILPGPGPNRQPNPPVLRSVASSISSTIITGTLAGAPNTTYLVQFFGSSPLDPTGVGQGALFLGQTTAITGADGLAGYSANVPALLQSGQLVTATATSPLGDTSAFSNPITEVFGTVQFQMASFVVNEGVGTATIVATRSGGSGGAFTVKYATADGSAVAGTDYLPASGTLTFQPGQTTQTFGVTIVNNGLPAPDKSLLLSLGGPTGPITVGPVSSAVLTIVGNQPGAFQFSMGGYSVAPNAGTATITVVRQQGGSAATVNYAASDGTAVAGTDYQPTSGTLNFGPGDLSQSFTVPILLDPFIKGNLSVILRLSSPTGGATLADPSTAVLTIVDDGVDRRGPRVISTRAVSGPYGTAEVVVGFDEPLNPTTAANLLNYGYAVRTAGRDGKLNTADDTLVGLCPATYDPAALTVTLPLGNAIKSGTKLLLMINQATDVPGQGVGVSDLLGNLLDGNADGHPGGVYSAVVVAQAAPSTAHATASNGSHPSKTTKPRHPATITPAKAHPKPHPAPKPKVPTHSHR